MLPMCSHAPIIFMLSYALSFMPLRLIFGRHQFYWSIIWKFFRFYLMSRNVGFTSSWILFFSYTVLLTVVSEGQICLSAFKEEKLAAEKNRRIFLHQIPVCSRAIKRNYLNVNWLNNAILQSETQSLPSAVS